MHGMQTIQSDFASLLSIATRFARFFARNGFFEVDDIVQEAMLKVLEKSDGRWPTAAWLYAVVRTTVCDAARKRSREHKYVTRIADEELSASVCEMADQKGYVSFNRTQSDELDMHDHDDLLTLQMVFAKLPPAAREILVLYASGYSYEQISQLTRANIGTVRSRLHYARKKARQLLEAGS